MIIKDCAKISDLYVSQQVQFLEPYKKKINYEKFTQSGKQTKQTRANQ